MFVILAAGKGTRFEDGSGIDKPLRELNGRKLIDIAIETAPVEPIVIGTPQVVDYLGSRVRTIRVEQTQPGPVGSALMASALIPAIEPVCFMDCDTVLDRDHVRSFYAKSGDRVAAAMAAVTQDTNRYCLFYTDKGIVTDIEEKGLAVGPSYVATGLYSFESFGLFYTLAVKTLAGAIGEVFMSSLLKKVMDKVLLQRIPAELWLPVGTAQALEKANERFAPV